MTNMDDALLDAEIWKEDSQEHHDLAETIVNRHALFAWMVVDAWCTKHGQQMRDNNYYGKV